MFGPCSEKVESRIRGCCAQDQNRFKACWMQIMRRLGADWERAGSRLREDGNIVFISLYGWSMVQLVLVIIGSMLAVSLGHLWKSPF